VSRSGSIRFRSECELRTKNANLILQVVTFDPSIQPDLADSRGWIAFDELPKPLKPAL
jgi:hypothetical protein